MIRLPAARAAREGLLAVLAFSITVAVASLAAGAAPDAATAALGAAGAALVYLMHRLLGVAAALDRSEDQARVLAGVGMRRAGRRELLEEKRRVLAAIKELDFDHAMGKLSDEDHRKVRARYERRALEVMRALEGTEHLHPWAQDLKVRAEGRAPRGLDVSPSTPPRACPACNAAADPDARFCKHCGAALP